jgi:hypothetical protein
MVTDATGGTMGLHKPGFRLAAGGHVGDQALRDAEQDECQRVYDNYQHQISNAWRRDAMAADPDDAEVEARAAAIRNALLSRGHPPDEVEDYFGGLEDDELLDGDIGEHVQSFEQQANGRDVRTVAVDRKLRLEELYQARDRAISKEWKKGK